MITLHLQWRSSQNWSWHVELVYHANFYYRYFRGCVFTVQQSWLYTVYKCYTCVLWLKMQWKLEKLTLQKAQQGPLAPARTNTQAEAAPGMRHKQTRVETARGAKWATDKTAPHDHFLLSKKRLRSEALTSTSLSFIKPVKTVQSVLR